MDHEIVQVGFELPSAYANAVEYAAAQMHLTQPELLILLIQLACIAQVDGELMEVGKELYNWLTQIENVPTDEVSL